MSEELDKQIESRQLVFFNISKLKNEVLDPTLLKLIHQNFSEEEKDSDSSSSESS